MERPLTGPEFARAIKRSESFVRNGRKLGKFNPVKVGNHWLYDPKEAKEFNRNPFQTGNKELREKLGWTMQKKRKSD